MGIWGEWEMGRWGEWEMGRVGEWESGRVGDGEMGRVGDGESGDNFPSSLKPQHHPSSFNIHPLHPLHNPLPNFLLSSPSLIYRNSCLSLEVL
ncbi:hypothetical protein QT995_08845 [Microcoleus sp. S36b_A3]|uniref:hypothetical protein n=1 Tax=unclassified Microcoleus TaxID=2642155 RepID=UPI002FD4C4DB